MKKISLLILGATIATGIYAQPGKTTVAKAPASPLKNLVDSASYAVGMSVATFYKQQGITKLNATIVSKAITDLLANKKPLMDGEAANEVLNKLMTQLAAQKSKPRVDSGIAFLAKNKTKPGIKTTASGIQYEVLREGTGARPTSPEDSVTVNYKGTLLNGTVFDNSYDRGQPITFPLNGVIKGWTEGVQLMNVGSKYKFYIPYTLAYGPSDYGPIPGGSMLIFEIELLDVKKK